MQLCPSTLTVGPTIQPFFANMMLAYLMQRLVKTLACFCSLRPSAITNETISTIAFWMMRNKLQRVNVPSHLSQNHIRSAEVRKITQLTLE